jgi:transcriptional regulator with GAF, ATPase, and Fis domain
MFPREPDDVRELINVNERFVFDAIERLFKEDKEMCRCEDCVLDTAALALNKLPAHYHHSSFVPMPSGVRGMRSFVPEDEKKLIATVEEAVREAMQRVKDHPNH